jgi:hypothetical protein
VKTDGTDYTVLKHFTGATDGGYPMASSLSDLGKRFRWRDIIAGPGRW